MKLSHEKNLSSLGKGTFHMGLASTEFTKQWSSIWIRALKILQLVQCWAWWREIMFSRQKNKEHDLRLGHLHLRRNISGPLSFYLVPIYNKWIALVYWCIFSVHCMAMVFWSLMIKQAVLESGRLYFSKYYWLSEFHKEAPSKPEYSLEYQHKTSRAQQDMKVTQIKPVNIACAKIMCRACHDS